MTASTPAPPIARGARWRSVQVHCGEADHDALVLDALRPLFHRLAGVIDQPYFVRHWLPEPHVRVNLRATATGWEHLVRPVATEVVTGFLRARGWQPGEALRFAPYDSRLPVLGSQDLVDLLDASCAESSALAFEMLDHLRHRRAGRLEMAVDLMFATAATSAPPITRGFRAYRAHAEGLLARCADPGAMRAVLDARYDQHRGLLAARLAAVLDTLDGTGDVPFVREWVGVADRSRAVAEPLFDAGRIWPDHHPRTDSPRPANPPGGPVLADAALLERFRVWPLLRYHRLTLNQLYCHLGRLGIDLGGRLLLCHLAANTVDEAYGISSLEAVRAAPLNAGGGAPVGR